jgi:DNA-binding FrmR family transcriptional regulator
VSHQEREKFKLLQRLKKLRGQLEAVERSLMADEDCGGQLMLLAAVRGGVNGLMGEVLETHIRFHLLDGAKEQIAPELAEDLIDLHRGHASGIGQPSKALPAYGRGPVARGLLRFG